ncbi:GNAT family N-acetyltransferase [Microbacterium sp. 10M-3C3]|jgi:RimJ/RimL family protein N-acetyltransferase|uniref:GNAT family N-acetyltransferase n=1 Tax=Microbacterium sp. 10M-3C3 TaxID=2483401 RepID=UPI000F63F8D1|nr:GNAT family N-acetyltransferase [Microbacterium sp. 10M-3C3]
MEPIELRTARTVLSVPTAADVPAIFVACQDADIQRFTTVPSPYLREHAEGFVAQARQRWADDVEATWAIRDGDTLAGMIGLHRLIGGSPELGYWMARGSRRRGLLTEAARAVIDWGFAPDGVHAARIEWRAVVGNRASARVAQALGFRYEGMLRQALANSLGRDDGWIAGLLATDERTPQHWPVPGA